MIERCHHSFEEKVLYINNVNDIDAMPQALKQYIKYIEDAVGVPITIISLGPDRAQTLIKESLSVTSN